VYGGKWGVGGLRYDVVANKDLGRILPLAASRRH